MGMSPAAHPTQMDMPRAYWVTFYRSVSNPAALAEYAALAGPAIEAGGGRFLARDTATQVFEGGLQQRVVIIEFDSVERALRTYQSSAYQTALKRLRGATERDVRIIEGTR
jgi:uncharacterized protein (DUF1330 family)